MAHKQIPSMSNTLRLSYLYNDLPCKYFYPGLGFWDDLVAKLPKTLAPDLKIEEKLYEEIKFQYEA